MKKEFKLMIVLSAMAFLFVTGCSCSGAPAQVESPEAEEITEVDDAAGEPMAECEACKKGKAGETIWCDSCGVGFVDGQKVTCKGCVEAAQSGTDCVACAGKEAPAEETPAAE